MRPHAILLGAAFVLISFPPLEAQVPAVPRELGMGGAYLAVARGHDAIFLNPANLGLSDGPAWSIGFPQVTVGGTIIGPTLRDLPALIDFRDIDEQRQSELLDLIPTTGTGGAFSFRAPIATVSVGGLGLAASYSSFGSHTISRGVAELVLRGYEDGRTDYTVGNTQGERATFWELAAAYGRSFGPVSIGVAGRKLQGGTLSRTRLFEPRIDVEARTIEVDYFGVSSSGGSGYAVDLGISYEARPNLTLGAALSNALGRMRWSEDLVLRSLTLDRDLIDGASPMDIRNRYHHSDRPLDPEAVPLAVFRTAEELYEGAFVPRVGRIGAAWKPAPDTRIAADFHGKLTAGRMGETWDRRVALGLQQNLSIFVLRAGIAAGGDGGDLLGGGLSIGALDLGVGRYHQGEAEGAIQRGWILTIGLATEQPRL